MLKAVIEEHHRAAELPFGASPGKMSIRAHEHGHTRKCTRQHLGLVAGVLDGHEHTFAVVDDNHSIDRVATRVASTPNP